MDQIDLESSDDDIQDIQQEISVLSTCDSPFVTRYKASFLRGHKLWIVMEYLGGGSCLDLVNQFNYRHSTLKYAKICSSKPAPSTKPISPSSAANYFSDSIICTKKARCIEISRLQTCCCASQGRSNWQTSESRRSLPTSNRNAILLSARRFGWPRR